MDCFRGLHESSASPYELLLNAATLIPVFHYLLGFLITSFLFLYNYLDFHFLQDFFNGFRGYPVGLTYNPNSHIYQSVVTKCRVLHSRYLSTPWLPSPHLQNFFLNFFGNPPAVTYYREVFRLLDGGTVALDWVVSSHLLPKDDTSTPIVVVLPGLTSDSESAYMRHLAFNTAKMGWHVVISNHRGLGGVPLTSDFFYNCGWTNDIREVSNHLRRKHPKAPLFLIGTSIGANILVKYLGEDGDNVPVSGAAAICNPWDFLIGDRFIRRTLLQKFYDKAITLGLERFSQMHQKFYSRLANWDGKMHCIRHYHATCDVGKFETIDTFYRRTSSAIYVRNVTVPLLCISALDDPICTREAIPWDECMENVNVVLAATEHGSHLAFFEGIAASGIWWVRAVDEFFKVLHCSQCMHVQKKMKSASGSEFSSDTTIDHHTSVAENGMVVALVKAVGVVKVIATVALVKVTAKKFGFVA